jgi:hypothetical protein
MSGAFLATAFLPTGFLTDEGAADQPALESGARWIKRAAERQQYIYYRRARIQRMAPLAATEEIERVIDQFDEPTAPSLTEAVALLARRGLPANLEYAELVRDELTRLHDQRLADDEDEVAAAIVMLLH